MIDRKEYLVRVDGPLAEVTIELRYRNRSKQPRYLHKCIAPEQPVLERLVDGTWVKAYQPVNLACLQAPIVIAPGAAYDYRWDVRAGVTGRISPTLEVREIPGRYRVIWRIRDRWDSAPRPGGAPPKAAEEVVSNTFALRLAN